MKNGSKLDIINYSLRPIRPIWTADVGVATHDTSSGDN